MYIGVIKMNVKQLKEILNKIQQEDTEVFLPAYSGRIHGSSFVREVTIEDIEIKEIVTDSCWESQFLIYPIYDSHLIEHKDSGRKLGIILGR